jgi:hypothetical protein
MYLRIQLEQVSWSGPRERSGSKDAAGGESVTFSTFLLACVDLFCVICFVSSVKPVARKKRWARSVPLRWKALIQVWTNIEREVAMAM